VLVGRYLALFEHVFKGGSSKEGILVFGELQSVFVFGFCDQLLDLRFVLLVQLALFLVVGGVVLYFGDLHQLLS
jgi:hypothetical protein